MAGKLDDISFQLGELRAELKFAVQKLDQIDARTANIEATAADVAALKPQVAELMQFKGRMGAVVGVAAAVVMGALALLWQGVTYFSAEIKALVGRLFS
jgi:hypothetical protein